MAALAEAALAILADGGERVAGDRPGHSVWRMTDTMPDGMALEIRCSGPDLPASVPSQTIFPGDIAKAPKWQEDYRLVVSPPVVAFDISWRGDEPLRILTFSRGDWEADLTARAGI